MKEVTINVKYKEVIRALVLGVFCSLGIFMSLASVATEENSPDIMLDNALMVFCRTLYRSFSAYNVRTLLGAIAAAALIYIGMQICAKKSLKIINAFVAVIFGICQTLCVSFRRTDSFDLIFGTEEDITFICQFRSLWKIIAFAILFYYVVLILNQVLAKVLMEKEQENPGFSIKWWLIGAAIMFVCWLPYFFIFYPGTSNEDTIIQIMEYFEIPSYIQKMTAVQADNIFITNHHPYLLTLLFGSFVKLGLAMGDIRKGVALYTLLHMAFLALTFSGAVRYVRSCGLSQKRTKILQLFIMFFPIFPLYSQIMVKDTLYSAFCLIYVLMLVEVVRTKGLAFKRWYFDLGIFVTGSCMILTKVYGMYVLALSGVVIFIIYRRYFLQIWASIALPIILYKYVFVAMLLPAMNVAPGGVQEAYSVPFQQTARYVVEYGDEVTASEKKAIRAVLPYSRLEELYNPRLSDPVKKRFKQDCTQEDIDNYFKVWKKMFFKHPEVYIEAWVANTYQYYDLDKISLFSYYEFNEYMQKYDYKGKTYQEYSYLFVENREETFVARYVIEQMILTIQEIPLLNWFVSIGMYPWIILGLFIFNFFNKKKEMNIPMMVLILTVGVCFVSPDNGNYRYIMPLVFSLPFIFSLTCIGENVVESD